MQQTTYVLQPPAELDSLGALSCRCQQWHRQQLCSPHCSCSALPPLCASVTGGMVLRQQLFFIKKPVPACCGAQPPTTRLIIKHCRAAAAVAGLTRSGHKRCWLGMVSTPLSVEQHPSRHAGHLLTCSGTSPSDTCTRLLSAVFAWVH